MKKKEKRNCVQMFLYVSRKCILWSATNFSLITLPQLQLQHCRLQPTSNVSHPILSKRRAAEIMKMHWCARLILRRQPTKFNRVVVKFKDFIKRCVYGMIPRLCHRLWPICLRWRCARRRASGVLCCRWFLIKILGRMFSVC